MVNSATYMNADMRRGGLLASIGIGAEGVYGLIARTPTKQLFPGVTIMMFFGERLVHASDWDVHIFKEFSLRGSSWRFEVATVAAWTFMKSLWVHRREHKRVRFFLQLP